MPLNSRQPSRPPRAKEIGERVPERTLYQQGCDAFHEHLAQMLEERAHQGKWVAFLGPRQFGPAEDHDEVYELAAAQFPGLKYEDLFISQITPEQEPLDSEMYDYR